MSEADWPGPRFRPATAQVVDTGLRAPDNFRRFFPELQFGGLRAGRANLRLMWGTAPGQSGGVLQVNVAPGLVASVSRRAPNLVGVLLPGPHQVEQLEPFPASAASQLAGVMDRAASLLAFKQEQGLSRFNDAPDPPGSIEGAVVVSAPTPATRLWHLPVPPLEDLIADARTAWPDHRVVVVGASSSCTADEVHAGDFDLVALVRTAFAVVSGADLIAYEALLAQTPARIHGAFPWPVDTESDPADGAERATRLFADSCLRDSRYLDPLTRLSCSAEHAFERLAAMRRHARRTRGRWRLIGAPPPKARVLARFLDGPMSSTRAGSDAKLREGETPLVWASPRGAAPWDRGPAPPDAVKVEDGFIRSVGLGASMLPAYSLVLDRRGAYYDPNSRSDLDEILDGALFSEADIQAGRKLRARLIELGVSKYNLKLVAPCLSAPAGRTRILVPGQVEDDASVTLGGQGRSNAWLLAQVRRRNPDAWISYKEHPDVTAGHRPGRLPPAAARFADVHLAAVDIIACIDQADEIHTLTSLAGFEALLRGKAVECYGIPFYAGRGLTTDHQPAPHPRRPLALDELVAGVLVAYPLYLDPLSGLPCDALTFVERLSQTRCRSGAWRSRPDVQKLLRFGLALPLTMGFAASGPRLY